MFIFFQSPIVRKLQRASAFCFVLLLATLMVFGDFGLVPVKRAYAATVVTDTFSTAGYNTWTAPEGVTSADIACWGGGGAGFDGNNSGGGRGGGGGAFASTTAVVSTGQVIRLFIGAGGATSGADGATSTASTTAPATLVTASPGTGGKDITTLGGEGGLSTISVGTVKFAGGRGGAGNGTSDGGGGGGGAGGPHGAGEAGGSADASIGGVGGRGDNLVGGTAGSAGNGSNGGIGGTSVNGGGGGGGGDNGTNAGDGGPYGGGGGGGEGLFGSGADGACTVTYSVTKPTVTTSAASSVTSSSATYNGDITANSATARGFAYGTSADLTTVTATTTSSGTFGISSFTLSTTTLSPSTTYYFRAFATNADGTSYGSIQPVTTSGAAPTVASDAATVVTASAATIGGTISDTGGSNATERGFATSTVSSLASSVSTSTESGSFSTGSWTAAFSNTSLTGNTSYYFRAYATTPGGTGYGDITPFLTLPDTPGSVSLTNVAATSTTVNWSAPIGGVASYKLQYCIDGTTTCTLSTGIGSGVTSTTTNPSLVGNTTYGFAIRGTNATGDGVFTATTTQLTLPDVPGTPSFTAVSYTTQTVSWVGSVGSSSSYKLERCSGAGCSDFAEIASGVGTTTYNDSSLSQGTTYRYRVRGTNATGDGLYSSGAESTTLVLITATLTGTLYSDEGQTPITSGKTIKVSVNGGTAASATSDGSGNFAITIDTPTLNSPIAVWVDADAGTRAFTLTKATTTVGVGPIPLYENRVTLLNQSTTTLTNANLALADSSFDADIRFTVTAGDLSVGTGQKLYVAPRTTFAPGGDVTLSDTSGSPDGDLGLGAQAVFYAGGTVSVGGSLLASTSANYIANGYTTEFTATDSGNRISGPFTEWRRLASTTFSGSGTWTMSGTASTTNFAITGSGTVVGAADATIAGNYLNSGTFTGSTGTTTFAAKYAVGGVDAGGGVTSGTGGLAFNGVFATTTNGTPYLYVARTGSVTNCGAPNHRGCELQIYDVSSSTNPVYVGGADASGSTNAGIVSSSFNDVYVLGNYAYAVKVADTTDCASATNHTGCELQIYDVSDPSAPVYVGGADRSGTANSGTEGSTSFDKVFVSGNYAYVGQPVSVTGACSTSAPLSCSMLIFDISTPSAPALVGGTNGAAIGIQTVNGLYVAGNYAYVTMAASSTACSSSEAGGNGCELKIYNISTPSAPVYTGGADAGGLTNSGTASTDFNSVFVLGDYAYVAMAASSTACSITAAEGNGCELKVFDIGSTPGTPTYVGGADAGGQTNAGTRSNGFAAVYVDGSYAYVGDGGSTSACSITAGSTNGCELKVFDVTTKSTPTYLGGADASGATNTGVISSSPLSVAVMGNTVLLGKSNNTAECSNPTNKSACELQIYDVSTKSTPTLALAMDSSGGQIDSTVLSAFNSVYVQGSYAYVAKAADATDCALTTNHVGCEFQIYDISGGGSPIYVGGADYGGNTNSGTTSVAFSSVYVSGSYAYLSGTGNAGTCSATPNAVGSATANGCEIKIFDISAPASPTLAAGIDAGGLINSGTENINVLSIQVAGDHLYAAMSADGSACSETGSSANGCEFKIFDVTSPTLPVYRAGTDSDGRVNAGTGILRSFNSISVSGNYAYIAAQASSTACSATPAIGSGCELMVFDITTKTAPAYVGGADAGGLTNQGTASTAFNSVLVSGNYAYVTMAASSTVCSITAGGASGEGNGCEFKVFDIGTTPGTPTYVGGADTSGAANSGVLATELSRVNVSGNYAFVTKAGNTTNCSSASTKTGCELQVYDISTPSVPVFVGGADASGAINSGIASGVGMNVAFATSSYVYTANGSDSTDCAYTTSRIGCEMHVYRMSDLVSGTSTLAGNTSDSSAFNNFVIQGGAQIAAPSALGITGNFINNGSFGASILGTTTFSGTDISLSGNLTATSTLGNIVFSGSGTTTISGAASTTNLTISANAKVAFDGLMSSSGTFSMLPGSYAQFLANATSTFQNISWEGSVGSPVTLRSSTGGTAWGLEVPGTRSVTYVDVADSNACSGNPEIEATVGTNSLGNTCWTFGATITIVTGGSGGGGHDAGGDAPAGDGDVGGGDVGGGEVIGDEPGFVAPSANGAASGYAVGWSSAGNAYSSDGSYATAAESAASNFYDFGFSIPSGDAVTGVKIKLEGSASGGAGGTLGVELSWDGGTTMTSAGTATGALTTSDVVYTLGSASALWGRTWAPSEFSNANFRVRIAATPSGNTLRIDAIQVIVYHQAQGGGGGGGGDI